MKNYYTGGRLAREEIASDICDGTLSRDDVKALIADPKVQASFIGNSFTKKKDHKEWNNEYLNRLPNYAIAESFNEDYLMYLLEVRDYVLLHKKKVLSFISKHKWICVLLGAIIVAGVIAIIISSTGTNPPPSVPIMP